MAELWYDLANFGNKGSIKVEGFCVKCNYISSTLHAVSQGLRSWFEDEHPAFSIYSHLRQCKDQIGSFGLSMIQLDSTQPQCGSVRHSQACEVSDGFRVIRYVLVCLRTCLRKYLFVNQVLRWRGSRALYGCNDPKHVAKARTCDNLNIL